MVYLQSKLNKKTLLGGALFLIVLFFFTSCENFLKADEVSQQIQAAIEYNNAPAYTIQFNSEQGSGVIKSPVGTEVSKKVTDVFNISFDPDDNYEFIEWKIKDIATNTELVNGEYLEIDSINKDSANCTFKNAPAAGMQLCIIPVVAHRPRIIEKSPKDYNVYRDAGILVMFDRVMDEDSLHYTKKEITELQILYDLKNEDFLPPIEDNLEDYSEDETTNCYGYKKGNETVYKVVEITDYNKNVSLLDHFGAPSLGDPKTLVIPIRKIEDGNSTTYKLLDNGTQVLVKLKNTIAYKNKKSVSLKDDEPWVYYVGSSQDNNGPTIDNSSTVKACDIKVNASDPSKDEEQSVALATSKNSAPTLYNRSLDFNFLVSDDGTATAPYFIMKFVDPDNYNMEEKIFYNTVTSAKARGYQGKYTLPEKYGNGTYRITDFIFYDNKDQPTKASNKLTSLTNQYFTIDTNPPSVNYTLELAESSAASSKFTLTYTNNNSSNPVRKGQIQYREYNSSQNQKEGWETIPEQAFYSSPCEIDCLQNNKKYEFRIQFTNKLGNTTTKYEIKCSRPDPIKNLNPSIVRSTTAIVKDVLNLTWENPTVAFNGIKVELVNADNNSVISSKEVNTNNNCKFEDLGFSKAIKARISIYKEDSGNKIYSIPCESEVIYTKPEVETYKGQSYYQYCTTNSVTIRWLKNNNITHYKVEYKLKSEADSQYTVVPDDAITESTSVTDRDYKITGLQSGYEYSLRITPYFHDASGTPYVITGTTRPPKVDDKSLKITTMDANYSNYIKVSWKKPQEGNFTNYFITLIKIGSGIQFQKALDSTVTEFTFDNTLKEYAKETNLKIDYLTDYKIELYTYLYGYTSDSEHISTTFTSAPKNVHMTERIKFDQDTYSSYPPYNNENTKLYLCYGSTVEEALQGSYYYTMTLSQKGFYFNPDVYDTIMNNIKSVDCYFVVKTVPPAGLSPFNGEPYYSEPHYVSIPPRPATSYGEDYQGTITWSTEFEDLIDVPYWYYYNSQTVTLKWKNPAQCDKINIYYGVDDDKSTWVFAKSVPVQEYAEVPINKQYHAKYDDERFNFVIIPVYKDTETGTPFVIEITTYDEYNKLNLKAAKEVVNGENKIKLTWQTPTGITFDRYNIEYVKKISTAPLDFDKDTLTTVNGKITYKEVSYNNYEYESGGVNKDQTSVYTEALEPGTYLFRFSIGKDGRYYCVSYVNYIEVTIQ